jgi:hypothetical protein
LALTGYTSKLFYGQRKNAYAGVGVLISSSVFADGVNCMQNDKIRKYTGLTDDEIVGLRMGK